MTKGNNTVKCTTPIAILLATYNGDSYLDSQIQSVINQTNDDWTLFIHDDESKDNTLNIINLWHSRYPERIIILDYPSQGGACANFMSMLEIVDADYYMFCDQDDVWHQDKITMTYAKMRELDDGHLPAVVHTDLRVVDSQLNIIAPSFLEYTNTYPDFCRSFKDCIVNTATGCTMLLNRKAREASLAHQWDKATMHDSWIVACTYHHGGRVGILHQQTIDYRQHGGNTLGAAPVSRLSVVYRLKNICSMQKKNIDGIRMLNAIGTFSLLDFFSVKLRYKHFINGCINNNSKL